MQLEITTIMIIQSLIALINAFTITVAWRGAKTMRTIIGYWSASQILLAVCDLLISLRNILPDFLTIIVANAFAVASQVLIMEGIFLYIGKTGYLRKASLGILTMQIALFLFFTYIQPDVVSRIVVYAISMALVCLLTLIGLFSRKKAFETPVIFFIGLLFFHISVMVFRSTVALRQGYYVDFLCAGFLQAVGLLGNIVYSVGLVICFFWIIAYQLRQESQQAEEKLQVAKDELEVIFNSSPDASIIIKIDDLRIVAVNDGFCLHTGFYKSDVIGKVGGDITLWKDVNDSVMIVEQILRHGVSENFECLLLRRDGSEFVAMISAKKLRLSGEPHFIMQLRDITYRRAVEENLRQSEELHRSILAASPDGVAITDIEGRIQVASYKMQEIFGTTGTDYFFGKKCMELLVPEDRDRAQNAIDQRLKGSLIGPRDYWGVRADGSQIAIEVNAECVRNTEGLPSGIVFVIRDISERKKIEADQQIFHSVQLVLAQISEAALMAKDLNEFYGKVHFLVGQILPAKNLYVALLDDTAGTIDYPYCVDESNLVPSQRKVGKGLTEYVMSLGHVIHLRKPELEALMASGKIVSPILHAQEYLGCPLLDKTGKIFGVIALNSWDEKPVFRAADMDLLSVVSLQVSLGIDRKRLENELQKQAIIDELTGVYNRRHFLSRAAEELKRQERYEGGCVLLMLDIDHFKKVNDLYGHAAGDAALRKVAAVCEEILRDSDVFGRIGGEEFAALLTEVSGEAGFLVAQRLRQNIEDIDFQSENGQPIELQASIGIAVRLTRKETLADLMKRADAALYRAKSEGRNRVVMSPD